MPSIKERSALFVSNCFFFLNTFLLPAPLLWTYFFSPVYWKRYLQRKILIGGGIMLLGYLIYTLIHLQLGVDEYYYFRSLALFILLPVCMPAVYFFIKNQKGKIDHYFSSAAIFGMALFLLSLLFLLFDQPILWKTHNFLAGGEIIWRYKGISYEPSFYAFVVSPLLIYFLLKTVFQFSIRNLLLLLAVAGPIAATISYGFFGVLGISLLLLIIILALMHSYFPGKLIIPFIGASIIFGFAFSQLDFLQNRIEVILKGEDTSINGRTWEAFYLAHEMSMAKSPWFGIGPGQVKILGEEFIRPYYGYDKSNWPTVALPNACAETLAIFGYLGLIARIFIQLAAFAWFKLHTNLFSLFLFLFLFIYQFMGSFILSGSEVTLWILACSNTFEEFNLKSLSKHR